MRKSESAVYVLTKENVQSYINQKKKKNPVTE